MILVTGATGLVGAHLLLELYRRNEPVRALIRENSDLSHPRKVWKAFGEDDEKIFTSVQWVKGDVLDVVSLEEAMRGVEKVYHTAAVVSFEPGDREYMYRTNVQGTAHVVNACLAAGVEKLCHVSSVAALGRTKKGDMYDENAVWESSKQNSAYSITKFEAEREAWRGSAEGLNVVIVNPSIILGYGAPDKGSTKMFSTIRKNSLFYGEGLNGFVDVMDVVRAMISLMESDIVNERFVVSGGNYPYRDIFGWMAEGFNKQKPRYKTSTGLLEVVWRLDWLRAKLTGAKPLITKETARTSKNRHYYDSSKLIKALGFRFTPMEETIKRTCRQLENFV